MAKHFSPSPLPDSACLQFKLVTFRLTAARAWVAVLSLNTHCKSIEHNQTACTQALSDDMPSMHQPNLHPLLPYKMHLLYVIILFEAHRHRDISSTLASSFHQLTPPPGSLHSRKDLLFNHISNRSLLQSPVSD